MYRGHQLSTSLLSSPDSNTCDISFSAPIGAPGSPHPKPQPTAHSLPIDLTENRSIARWLCRICLVVVNIMSWLMRCELLPNKRPSPPSWDDNMADGRYHNMHAQSFNQVKKVVWSRQCSTSSSTGERRVLLPLSLIANNDGDWLMVMVIVDGRRVEVKWKIFDLCGYDTGETSGENGGKRDKDT